MWEGRTFPRSLNVGPNGPNVTTFLMSDTLHSINIASLHPLSEGYPVISPTE